MDVVVNVLPMSPFGRQIFNCIYTFFTYCTYVISYESCTQLSRPSAIYVQAYSFPATPDLIQDTPQSIYMLSMKSDGGPRGTAEAQASIEQT